jgi:phage terminase small subunit
MPILKNVRHEKVCREFVSGPNAGNKTASHAAAGFSGDKRDAGKFFNRPDVKARVIELQEQFDKADRKALEIACERLAITKENVLAELAKIGFANMLDYVRVTDEGEAYVDLSALDRDKAAAIQEVTVDTYQEGRGDDAREVKRIKFKLGDKRAALVDIGKHLGMFVERRHVTVEHADKSNAEISGEIAELFNVLREMGVEIPGGHSQGNPNPANGTPPTSTAH